MLPTDHFYVICKQGLDSAKRGQYGEGFTPDDLRANLAEEARGFDINWGPASKTPFDMIDPGIDLMNQYIEKAVACYTNWLASQVK